MELNKKISVIMPAYNTEKFIADALESLLSQTYSKWELVVIDDGSPDETGKIIDMYAAKDGRINVIHSLNGGESRARNTGLDYVMGEWIVFLDSDDLLMPDALFNLSSASENKDFVVGNFCEFPRIKQKNFFVDAENIERAELVALFSTIGAAWGMMFKRDAIAERFIDGLQLGADTIFRYSYLSHCSHISTVHNFVYLYRRNRNDSLSRQVQNMNMIYIENFCQLYGEILGTSSEYYRAYIAHTFVAYIYRMIHTDKLSKAEKIDRIREVLESNYFCELPLSQLKLRPQEMRMFAILKTGDMALIEKDFCLE